MHAATFLHKLLGSAIHKSRLKMLIPIVSALLTVKTLKLTTLARSLDLPLQERHAIRKMDKFLANVYFQTRSCEIYHEIIQWVVGNKRRPPIIVDWTKLPNVNEYALRAALVAEGRAITLYEEVHPKKKEGTREVHEQFLARLKGLLPTDCRPIIITDAGFKNPWFKKVESLGWDFVGRVRGKTNYKTTGDWLYCDKLHEQATTTPQSLGDKTLAKKTPMTMAFYLVRQTIQGRKRLTRSKEVRKDKDSKNYGRSYREPWLLVSSIKGYGAAKKIVKLYKRRMTIEEGFRDLKSTAYGFSMEQNKTEKSERLIVWLMLAALASLFAWIVGRVAESINLQYQFQANTIRNKRVLSFFFLGCQIIRKKMKVPIDWADIRFVDEEILL